MRMSAARVCVRFLGHLVGYSGVSRDLPSSRWRTSVQNLPQETSRSPRCVRIPPSVQHAPALEAMVTSC